MGEGSKRKSTQGYPENDTWRNAREIKTVVPLMLGNQLAPVRQTYFTNLGPHLISCFRMLTCLSPGRCRLPCGPKSHRRFRALPLYPVDKIGGDFLSWYPCFLWMLLWFCRSFPFPLPATQVFLTPFLFQLNFRLPVPQSIVTTNSLAN